MRRRLGESLSTVQKYNTPLEQATTRSLEALQAYSLGFKTLGAGDSAAALPFFQRATELDPNFAMAYWALANNSADSALSAGSARKAFELRAGLSEREKLHIEILYYSSVTGDLIKARRSCEIGAQMYPRDSIFLGYLPTFSNALGEYEAGLKESLEESHHPTHSSPPPYRDLVFSYLLLDRIKEADAVAEEAHAKGQDTDLETVLYGIAFYRDDIAGMARQVARATGAPGEDDLLLAMEADTAAYFGHLGKAQESSRRAADSAELAAEKETAASFYAVSALREALF